MMEKDSLVSIIIPVRRKENISGLMMALTKSTYMNFEIIIVDRGKERSEQRNIGIGQAKGKYLLILDSDQHPSPCLIEECIRLSWTYDALYIREKIMTKGLFGYIRNWERWFYTGGPIDVVRWVKRQGCPLFDPKQSGPEDSDWDRRVKGNRATTKNVFFHYENVNLGAYLKKKAYYSKSMSRFAKRNPGDKILDWRWRCFGVFLEDDKWKRFLSRPDLALAVLFLIFLRGIVYVKNRNCPGQL